MSSLIPGFEYDIFISYRQKDNKGERWVTEFVSALKNELESTFKEDISIYFDENPHDGLLETHDVDGSLKEKLKCLIFIPIISQTYCDTKSFAWNNEFLAFLKTAAADSKGLKVRLPGGNMASRVLPIRIHELDARDKKLIETELQGSLRAIDFTLKSAGVNRPLRPKDDESAKSAAQTVYRDQINKAANAIKDILSGLPGGEESPSLAGSSAEEKVQASTTRKLPPRRKWNINFAQLAARLSSHLPFIAAVSALTVLAAIHYSETPPDTRTYRATILPPQKTYFTTTSGGNGAVSPDGQSLAFVATDSAGKTLLWVRPLNALTGRSLNGTDGASFPFWSPDNRFIGFFADGKLKKIEASGGPAQTLCDAAEGRGGAWNENGTIIFCPDSSGPFGLFRVSAAGGSPVAITKLDSSLRQTSHRWPRFLPDGQHFLYLSRTGTGAVTEGDAIFLGSLDTTFVPRVIAKAGSSVEYANGHILFTREQTLMAQPFDAQHLQTMDDAFPIAERLYFESFTGKASFSASQNGILVYQSGGSSSEIWLRWIDRNGKPTGTISQTSAYWNLRISGDGKRIVISQNTSGAPDIWLYEMSRAAWTRFTFDPAIERWPIWSPDGSTIVFSSNRKKSFDLFQRASSGAGSEELLLGSNFDKAPTDWSRDGRFIAYTVTDPKTRREDIWILPMDDKRIPFVFLQTEFNELRAAFSPDGRWIAYQSDESGRFEVYIRPFPGPGGKWQVSTGGGTRPRWRSDGKELFFYRGDGTILAAQIKLGPASIDADSGRTLFKVVALGGALRDIYDVTGDGQRFLVAGPEDANSSSPFSLVVNWQAEVKKK